MYKLQTGGAITGGSAEQRSTSCRVQAGGGNTRSLVITGGSVITGGLVIIGCSVMTGG